MARNLTGETYALKNAESLRPKIWGAGRPFSEWWPDVQKRLDQYSVVNCGLVERIADGSLPKAQVDAFIKDLVILAKQLPMHESRFAARSNFHGEDTVLIMSHGPALALGYGGFRFMPELAREFAAAYGIDKAGIDSHRLSRWPTAFLNALYDYSSYPEMGIAATLVDTQWEPIANRLKKAFQTHYRVPAEKTEFFDALAAMDGPRGRMRPVILEDMARTAYHQSMVKKSVITVTSLWRQMWHAWENPNLCGFASRPKIGGH